MTLNLNLLQLFAAVAEERNFRAAADRLGVTRSAVSQAVRRLEDSHGLALVQRTTRSVRLTETGEALYRQIAGPLQEIATALDVVSGAMGRPRGILRVAVTSIAERFLSGPLIASFVAEFPEITLDVTVTDGEFDIVEAGYDAGVRLGEVIEADMVAVKLTGPQRQVTVATPDYIARHGAPQHPRELMAHRCIGWRPSRDVPPYRWEFAENGEAFDVAVTETVTTNDMLLMIRTALAGGGITFGMEETFLPYIARGELVRMLDDYLPSFPGFYLYFPSRRTVEPKLRALIDHARSVDAAARG